MQEGRVGLCEKIWYPLCLFRCYWLLLALASLAAFISDPCPSLSGSQQVLGVLISDRPLP